MTEKCSKYNLRYYLFQMGRLKSCTVFNIIFAICGFPMLTIADYLIGAWRKNDELASGLLIVGMIGIMGVCAMSYITPIIALKHLYNKNVADNILSLPLTTNRRFLSDILAILSSFHLPFGVSVAITGILECFIFHSGNFSSTWYFYYSLVGLSLLLAFCAVNIAIISCCGRLLEAVAYPFALNIVLPLSLVFGMYISYSGSFGIYNYGDEIFQNYLLLLFPFSAAFTRTDTIIANPLTIVFIEVGVSLVYFALSFLAYKKRHAENIGKSFIFKYSYLLVSTVISIAFILGYTAVYKLNGHDMNNYFGTILVIAVILFILMLIMEVVNYRKIKSILKFILRYAGTLCGGLALCYLLFLSRGFGASYYIPAANEVENAIITVYYNNQHDVKMPVPQTFIASFTAEDEEGIELIRKAHKSIIDTYDNEAGDTTYAYMRYIHDNNKATHRNYDMQFALYDGFWEEVVNSKSYRLEKLADLSNRFNYDDYIGTAFRLKNFNSDVVYFTKEIDIKESGLIEALKADLLNDEEYGRHDEYPLAALQIGEFQMVGYVDNTTGEEFYSRSQDFAIYESYTNTIEFLSKYGTVPTMEEAVEDSVNSCDVFALYKIKDVNTDDPVFELHTIRNAEIILLTEDEYKELAKYQSEYAYTDEIDQVYKVTRGFSLNTDYIVNEEDLITAYEEAGGKNVGIFKSSYVYQLNDSGDYLLNESTYELCEELFANKKVLIYKNTY